MASDYRIRLCLADGEALLCGQCETLIKGEEYIPNAPLKKERGTAYIGDPEEMPITVKCSVCYLAEGREAEDESSTGLGFNPDGTERFPTPCGHEDAPCCGCHLERDHGDSEPDFDDDDRW